MLSLPAFSSPLINEDLLGRAAVAWCLLLITGFSAMRRVTAWYQPGQATCRARPNVCSQCSSVFIHWSCIHVLKTLSSLKSRQLTGASSLSTIRSFWSLHLWFSLYCLFHCTIHLLKMGKCLFFNCKQTVAILIFVEISCSYKFLTKCTRLHVYSACFHHAIAFSHMYVPHIFRFIIHCIGIIKHYILKYQSHWRKSSTPVNLA